jgi:GTP cyclohydrolase I
MSVRKNKYIIINLVLALVGTNNDRYELEEVPEREAKSFAKEINAIYQLISAKNRTGIDELFENIGKKFLDIILSQEEEKYKEIEENDSNDSYESNKKRTKKK